MAINVRSETINVIKKLTKLEFDRDPVTGELRVESQYTTGYEDAEVGFVTIETGLRSFGPTQSAWTLARKPSEGGLTDPTLAEFLTVLFDGIETGQIVLPEEPVLEPEPV
jgi:hypothetical protein